MKNPFEMDLEEDEETGEVILPPDYKGKRPRGFAQMNMKSGYRAPVQDTVRAPSGSNGSATPNGSSGTTDVHLDPPTCPECPPCPRCGAVAGSSTGSLLGIVSGLSLLGGILWYTSKTLVLSDYEEEDLPEGPPVIEASVVDEVPMGALEAGG